MIDDYIFYHYKLIGYSGKDKSIKTPMYRSS